MDNERLDFGTILLSLREQRNLSQDQLAKKAGLTPSLIFEYESGVKKPKADRLIRLAMALDTSTDNLLGLTHEIVIKVEGLTDSQIGCIESYSTAIRDEFLKANQQIKTGD